MKGLEIFWIRHSVSKANITNIFEKIVNNTVFYFSSKDPEIISDAESGSCYLGKNLNKDISDSAMVGCSEMRRAIQTAILMFPKQFKEGKLKVLPGIQEKGFGAGNIALSTEANKRFLIDWCVKMRKKSECERFGKLMKDRVQIEKAVNKIYSDLDAPEFKSIREEKSAKEVQFLNCLIPYLASKRVKKIPIVSHSNYIRDEIMVKDLIRRIEDKYLRGDKKLYNNQILKKEYEYDKKKIYVRDQVIYDFGCVYEDRVVDCYH
jgi:hypothetical protein